MSNGGIDADAVRRLFAESKASDSRGNQGDVRIVTVDGRRIAIKATHGNPLADFIRRRMLRREYDAYSRLRDVEGVPRCYGFFDDRYLVLEAINGRTLRQAAVTDRERFFERLRQIIDAIHARGVAHGDLTRRDNILVDETGCPVLIDFGVSAIYRKGAHPLNHWLYGFLSQHDLNAWLKHKYERQWDRMSPEDARYYRPHPINMMARRIKRAWRTLHRGKRAGS